MAMKYHVNNQDIPMPCSAKSEETCKFSTSSPHGTREEMFKVAEDRLERKHSYLQSLQRESLEDEQYGEDDTEPEEAVSEAEPARAEDRAAEKRREAQRERLRKTVSRQRRLARERKSIDHTDPRMLSAIKYDRDYDRGTNGKNTLDAHYSLNCGRLNPHSYEGSANDYIRRNDGALVILAERDGKRARAISSATEMFRNPDASLGADAVQVKQMPSGGPDKETPNLIVAGYINEDGEKFGYIPDKQVSAFVYK